MSRFISPSLSVRFSLSLLFAALLLVFAGACGDEGSGSATPSPQASSLSDAQVQNFCESHENWVEDQRTDDDVIAFHCIMTVLEDSISFDPASYCEDVYQVCVDSMSLSSDESGDDDFDEGDGAAGPEDCGFDEVWAVDRDGETYCLTQCFDDTNCVPDRQCDTRGLCSMREGATPGGETSGGEGPILTPEPASCVLAEIDRSECNATLADIRACERSLINEELSYLRNFTCTEVMEILNPMDELNEACRIVNNACPAYFGHQFPVDESGDDEPGDDEPGDDEPGEESTFEPAWIFVAPVIFENELNIVGCECSWTDHVSLQECLAEETYPQSSIDALLFCIEHAAAHYPPSPPQNVVDFVACREETYAARIACIDHLAVCTEAGYNSFSACDEEVIEEDARCIAYIDGDEAANDWLEEFSEYLREEC